MADAGDRKQLRKAGRREAQAAKMSAKADDEAKYFWECARRAAASGGARGPPPPSAAASEAMARELFGTQGTSGINFDACVSVCDH